MKNLHLLDPHIVPNSFFFSSVNHKRWISGVKMLFMSVKLQKAHKNIVKYSPLWAIIPRSWYLCEMSSLKCILWNYFKTSYLYIYKTTTQQMYKWRWNPGFDFGPFQASFTLSAKIHLSTSSPYVIIETLCTDVTYRTHHCDFYFIINRLSLHIRQEFYWLAFIYWTLLWSEISLKEGERTMSFY